MSYHAAIFCVVVMLFLILIGGIVTNRNLVVLINEVHMLRNER